MMNPPLFQAPNGADDFHAGSAGIAAEAGAAAVTTAAVMVAAATRLSSACRMGAPHCAGVSDSPDDSGPAGKRKRIWQYSIAIHGWRAAARSITGTSRIN